MFVRKLALRVSLLAIAEVAAEPADMTSFDGYVLAVDEAAKCMRRSANSEAAR